MRFFAVALCAMTLAAAIPELPELNRMIARFAPASITAPSAGLSAGDQKALAKLTEAARVIRETVPEGGTLGIFPEPGFLLFATGRRNPFVDELFLPGIQNATAEDLMISRLRERPPDALLVTNRAFPEFGSAVYGNGLLDRFFMEVSQRYVPVRRVGGGPAPPARRASEGILFLKAPKGGEAKDP